MGIRFDWDINKALINFKKHSVPFEEATTVFTDVLSLTIADPLHSDDEDRLIIVGQSVKKRLLVVVHTDMGDTIRIISARLASKKERKFYESESNKLW